MRNLLGLVLGLVLAVGCAANRESEDHEVSVPLEDVPAVARGAAEKEVPGITSAEREVENGVVVYDLEGKTKDGTEYEIEVTETGKIIEVEKEGDDDDY